MDLFFDKYDIDDKSQLFSYKMKHIGRSKNKITEFEKETENNLVFYKTNNGYVATTLKNRKNLFIHQIITRCYGNGRGTKTISVDHIDQNPLNNCFSNLRIADRKTQEKNPKSFIT